MPNIPYIKGHLTGFYFFLVQNHRKRHLSLKCPLKFICMENTLEGFQKCLWIYSAPTRLVLKKADWVDGRILPIRFRCFGIRRNFHIIKNRHLPLETKERCLFGRIAEEFMGQVINLFLKDKYIC